MTNVLRLLLLLAAVAAVAVASCWLSGRYFRHGSTDRSVASHQWIHQELRIGTDQDKALAPVEERYAARRREMTEAIRQANMELARAISQDREYSPRVTAAIEKIHHAQGELQKATLEHVFEMRSALTPEQYEKLLRSTAAALEAQPNE